MVFLGALRAVVVGALKLDIAKNRLQVLAAIVDELGLVAVAAGNTRARMATVIAVEQLLQQHRARSVHRAADVELRGPQIHRAATLALGKKERGYPLDFLRDLRLDAFEDFFLRPTRSVCCVAASIGRAVQICSLSSMISWTSWRKRW